MFIAHALGDRYEREADRAAEQVMRMTEDATAAPLQCQRVESGGGTEAPPAVHEALRASGRPLDGGTAAFMEARLGHDFSSVRVHDDARASASAQAVGARAYTVGRDVVFGAGQYAPGTVEGRRLLAHELTHVVQQGAVGGRPMMLQRQAEGEPPTASPVTEGGCSGWLSDPQSFSIVVARAFLRDEGAAAAGGPVSRVVCERTSKRPTFTWDRCLVHFADGTVVRVVLFSETTTIVSMVNPPSDRFCHYVQECSRDGNMTSRRHNCGSISGP